MALLPIIKDKIEDNEDKELLEIVIRNINYMKDLVIKTIDLAKLNTDKIDFNFEKTNLLSEIENVIKNNEILLKNTNLPWFPTWLPSSLPQLPWPMWCASSVAKRFPSPVRSALTA